MRSLGVQVEHLVAYVFKQFQCDILDNELIPLAAVACRPALPVSNVKLGESTGEVHDGYSNDLRFPLETQCCAQTVVNKSPCHLHHLLHFAFVTFNEFGEFEKISIWVFDHQVKLDCLKKYSLQGHHFLLLYLCVVAKVCKLGISQHCTESLDDVLAFLGRFLHFASKK